MKPWYKELFENYAQTYDREVFTQGTLQECDFIERETGGDQSRKILDVGCGTGRHDIELARRGYRVTGIDLSESQLAHARAKAREAGVEASFIQADARELAFREEFDVALMICEGAFPLMETDRENFRILGGIAAALRPGGKLILTTLSVLYPLFHSVKDFVTGKLVDGEMSGHSFDLLTFRDHSILEIADDNGKQRKLTCNERYYAPSEMTWLLDSLGFSRVEIFGGVIGAFSRDKKLTPDDFEMLVIADK